MQLLQNYVRSRFIADEYPKSMMQMYLTTPHEAIPEFYSDPTVFTSIHSEMNDISLPEWASSPHQFVQIHESLLNSNEVGKKLHEWIDLMFGFKLFGLQSILAKNVPLLTDRNRGQWVGFIPLFSHQHPRQTVQFSSSYPHSSEKPISLLSLTENRILEGL